MVTVRIFGDERSKWSDAGPRTHAYGQPAQFSRAFVEAKVHRSFPHPNRHEGPWGATGQEIGAEPESFLDEQLRPETDDRDQELDLSRVGAGRGGDGERPRADWRHEVEEVLEGDVGRRVAKVVEDFEDVSSRSIYVVVQVCNRDELQISCVYSQCRFSCREVPCWPSAVLNSMSFSFSKIS